MSLGGITGRMHSCLDVYVLQNEDLRRREVWGGRGWWGCVCMLFGDGSVGQTVLAFSPFLCFLVGGT